ncbi:hypothetical protein CALVIDRAFT_527826 [Calocera viscosa TUFC12733]|uniref:Uncharacterized protein n=1 Tax=Calocera viscosa (strain TUFC12733) TaxID=1330018 RepID=A0A167LVY7_CALVF|nr:hypothetical protein CALVIDRAFT_527826 [Calocera viscosa TUFC12733]
MDDSDDDFAPASPSSLTSSMSLPAALDTLHSGLSDIKLAESIFSPSRKTSEGSNYYFTPPEQPEKKGKKKESVYAPEEDKGEASGGATGRASEWEQTPAALKSAIVAAIRAVELQIGAPALVGGLPLIGLLEAEGTTQDTLERPKICVAKPEDLAKVDEKDEASKPAVDHKTGTDLPAPFIPNLDDLKEERTPPWGDLAELTAGEDDQELGRLVQPAYEYGKHLRRVELAAEEGRLKDALRAYRQSKHDAVWDANVAKGKKYVDSQKSTISTLKRIEDTKLLFALNAQETKQKAVPTFKRLFTKYGPSVAKVGAKIGMEALEQQMMTM